MREKSGENAEDDTLLYAYVFWYTVDVIVLIRTQIQMTVYHFAKGVRYVFTEMERHGCGGFLVAIAAKKNTDARTEHDTNRKKKHKQTIVNHI